MISRFQRQPRPGPARLVFRCCLGQQLEKPFRRIWRKKPDGGQLTVRSVAAAGFSIFALTSWTPAAGQEFLGYRPALLDGGEMRRQHAIDVFGAHAERLVSS